MPSLEENLKAEEAFYKLCECSNSPELLWAKRTIEDLQRETWMHWTMMNSVRHEYEKRMEMLSGGE